MSDYDQETNVQVNFDSFISSLYNQTLKGGHLRALAAYCKDSNTINELCDQHSTELVAALRIALRKIDCPGCAVACQMLELLAWAAAPAASTILRELMPSLVYLTTARVSANVHAVNALAATIFFTASSATEATDVFNGIVAILSTPTPAPTDGMVAAAGNAVALLVPRFDASEAASFLEDHVDTLCEAIERCGSDAAFAVARAGVVALECAREDGDEEETEHLREALLDAVNNRAHEHNKAAKRRDMKDQHSRFRELAAYLEDGTVDETTVKLGAGSHEEIELASWADRTRYSIMLGVLGGITLLRTASHLREEFGLSATYTPLSKTERTQYTHQQAQEMRAARARKDANERKIKVLRSQAGAASIPRED